MKDARKPSVYKLENRRVILSPTEEGCPMHGPWKLKFRKLLEKKDVEGKALHELTGVSSKAEYHECGAATVESEIQLTDQAMRGIVGTYLQRQAIKTVDALWKWLEENK